MLDPKIKTVVLSGVKGFYLCSDSLSKAAHKKLLYKPINTK